VETLVHIDARKSLQKYRTGSKMIIETQQNAIDRIKGFAEKDDNDLLSNASLQNHSKNIFQ
jgi:hypothetical protein